MIVSWKTHQRASIGTYGEWQVILPILLQLAPPSFCSSDLSPQWSTSSHVSSLSIHMVSGRLSYLYYYSWRLLPFARLTCHHSDLRHHTWAPCLYICDWRYTQSQTRIPHLCHALKPKKVWNVLQRTTFFLKHKIYFEIYYREQWVFFQFVSLIDGLVSSFWFIWIPILWIYEQWPTNIFF